MAERGLVTHDDEVVGRRAAYGTLGLAVFAVVALLLLAANLVILLVTGAQPNELESARQTAWLQWRGRFPIEIPWWLFLVSAAGWIAVLRMVWRPERHYVRRVGPIFLLAGASIVALLSGVTAVVAGTWARWYYRDGWELYLIPVALLVIVAVVAGTRAVQLNRGRPTGRTRARGVRAGDS